MLNWKCSAKDHEALRAVFYRAESLLARHGHAVPDDLYVDLSAVHCNEGELDLDRLMAAPEVDFAHDVMGIHRHVDRSTGKLGDCFMPRCGFRTVSATH